LKNIFTHLPLFVSRLIRQSIARLKQGLQLRNASQNTASLLPYRSKKTLMENAMSDQNQSGNNSSDQAGVVSAANVAGTNADAPEGVQTVSSDPAARVAELEQLLADATLKAQENYDQFVRAKAETDNVRRRSAEDVLKAQKFGVEKIAESLLAVKDSLDAALVVENASVDTFKSGVEITLRQLGQVFDKFSIREESPEGQKFDPTKHQSIAALESDAPVNSVVGVMQKGYMLHDRVLRPALVTVAKARSMPEPEINAS
jgi:molecular chaperone GrpE